MSLDCAQANSPAFENPTHDDPLRMSSFQLPHAALYGASRLSKLAVRDFL